MKKKKWASTQSIIIISIIFLIISYIAFDIFIAKPEIKQELKQVELKYEKLDEKLVEIDSTFKKHSIQMTQQKEQINTLENTFKDLSEK